MFQEKGILIVSRVVPGISQVTTLSSPSNLFTVVDFPTLGLPITASEILSTPSDCSSLFNLFTDDI